MKANMTELQLRAWQIRRLVLEMDYQTDSGHIGGAMSSAEILASLFFGVMQHSPERAASKDQTRDRFVLSKGHISDGYYAALALAGYFPTEELNTYCGYESRLSGHPTVKVPGVEFNTGALGHGLSNAVGLALAARADQLSSRIFCLLGDGELAEGSVWEAAMSAAHYHLDHLTAIVDRNYLQIGGCTEDLMGLDPLDKKWSAFGWEVMSVDGHDVSALIQALSAPSAGKPRVLIARTVKGRGVSFMENNAKWHHGVLNNDEYLLAVSELNEQINAFAEKLGVAAAYAAAPQPKEAKKKTSASWIPARQAVLDMLTERAKEDPRIVTLTSDARGSANMGGFIKTHPDRIFEIGIAEQNEVGVAAGLAVGGKIPFVCAPACFLSARSYEQVKTDMAYTGTNVKLLGVSGGVAYGELGQTHHSLQDAAAFRALPGMRVIIPADAVSARVLAEQELSLFGPSYIRVGRAATAPLYSEEEAASLRIGKAHIARHGKDGCVITSGILLSHALQAAESLSEQGLELTVIDMHTLKPFDEEAIRQAAAQFGRLLTVEEHVRSGGLGSAVCEAISECPVPVKVIAFPDENAPSATANQLYKRYGMDAESLKKEFAQWFKA